MREDKRNLRNKASPETDAGCGRRRLRCGYGTDRRREQTGLFGVLPPVLLILVPLLLFELLLFSTDHKDHKQECYADYHPDGEHSCPLGAEFVIIALQIDDDNDPGKNIGHISADELREFHTVSGMLLPGTNDLSYNPPKPMCRPLPGNSSQ